ncbi:MAG: GIY-YIG nuclease family protein [Candidatus Magasanikbacteria bacterium]
MPYFTYLARCNDKSLYIGSCKNLEKREKRHNKGEGANYTKVRRPIQIVYSEEYTTPVEARRREKQIKGWTRMKKERLIHRVHPNPKK